MFVTGIYEEIPLNVREKIRKEVSNLGYSLNQIVRYSNHPNDNYLYLVMAKGGYKSGYVTWLYNDSVGGLCEGHYDMTFKNALTNLAKRVVEIEEYNYIGGN